MPALLVIQPGSKRIPFPIYYHHPGFPWQDDRPLGINLSDVVAGDPRPIPWAETLGISRSQLVQIAALTAISEAVPGLGTDVGKKIGEALEEQVKSMSLPVDVSVELDQSWRERSRAPR